MREAYGAMWIFAICLIFIILMTAYLAISVNYAKAFRIKDQVISYIEENEGYDATLNPTIENYFSNQGYTARGECQNHISVPGYDTDWELVACVDEDETSRCGACVYKTMSPIRQEGICADRSRYRVLTFFKFDIPVIHFLTTFQVGGESRYLFDFASSGGC